MSRLKYWRKMFSKKASPSLRSHAKMMYSRYGGRHKTASFSSLRKRNFIK